MNRDWRQMAAGVRAAMDRADWTERQRRVAGLLVKATLMRGRLTVRVPRLEEFARVTRMSRGNLSEVFSALQVARFCHVQALDGGGAEYTIQADWTQWDVVELYSAEEQRSFLRDLDAWTGQVQGELLAPEPSLSRAVMEVGAERAQQAFPNRERPANLVPESGTPFKGLKEVQRFNPSSPIELSMVKPLNADPSERLKAAVAAVRDGEEADAMRAVRTLLGDAIYDSDGGKWRNRLRVNRDKVGRVFSALAEDLVRQRVRKTGAHAEWLWKTFA